MTDKIKGRVLHGKVFIESALYPYSILCVQTQSHYLMVYTALCLFNTLSLIDGNTGLKIEDIEDLVNHGRSIEGSYFFDLKRYVYNDLFQKSWIIRSGHSYGGEFVLYEDDPEKAHSRYVVSVVCKERDYESLTMCRLMCMSRVCVAAKKTLLLAMVDLHKDELKKIHYKYVQRWDPEASDGSEILPSLSEYIKSFKKSKSISESDLSKNLE